MKRRADVADLAAAKKLPDPFDVRIVEKPIPPAPGSSEQQHVDEADGRRRRADTVLSMVQPMAEFFHDSDGIPYAKTQEGTIPIRSRAFRTWLSGAVFDIEGRGVGSKIAEDVVTTAEAIALRQGEQRDVHIRTATHDGEIWIDLGDETRDAVRVTEKGWDIVPSSACPVRFVRPSALRPLPRPERGGSVGDLRQFLNVADENGFVLAVAWIVAALRADRPFPLAVLTGEQGTGKSTASRVLRSLVDPNKSDIRATPKDLGDLKVAAKNSHVLAFDNLSGVPPWLADGLCRIATGGGFASRTLYTDDDEHVVEAKRPVILNGIDDMTERPVAAGLVRHLFHRDHRGPDAHAEKRRPAAFVSDDRSGA